MHGAPLTAQASPPPLQLLGHFWDLASLEEVSRAAAIASRNCQPPLPTLLPAFFVPTPPTLPSSAQQDAREKAAAALVEALVANQAEFEAESGAEASDEDEAAANGGGGGRGSDVARALRRCSPLMVYAFKRLCRGLGSSRQGARQGFSLAISALLGATQCIGPGEAVAAIEGVLEPVGKVRPRLAPVLPAAEPANR